MKRPKNGHDELNEYIDFIEAKNKALIKYIDYILDKDLKCKHDFDCGIEYCELKKCTKFEMK